MDISLVETGEEGSYEPVGSVVLGDPRFTYVPLWDTGEDEVYAYRCMPLWQDESGQFEPIEAFGAAFADPLERLSIDIAVFDKAIGHVNRIVAQYGIVKILIPVHMSTLMDVQSRDTYLSICSESVWSVFDNVCFEIVEPGAEVATDQLAAAVNVIQPYGSEIFVCLDSNDIGLVPVSAEIRPVIVGLNVRRLEAMGCDVTSELAEFGARVAQSKFRSYVHGIDSVETTASAIAAGFSLIGSEAISPALDEPAQPIATDDTARMLRTLMAGKRRI